MGTHIFSFKAQFVPLIERRAKRQTIRSPRKRMPVVGDTMRLQHGPRFNPSLLGFAEVLSVGEVRLDFETRFVATLGLGFADADELDEFARGDGFVGSAPWAEMEAFWRANHPEAFPRFTGALFQWGDTFKPGERS